MTLKIKRVLEERGISQSKLARLADVNQTEVNRIVNGKEPSYPIRGKRIADALGWTGPVGDLFKEDDND